MKYCLLVLFLIISTQSILAQHSRWNVKTLNANFKPEMYGNVFYTPENFAKPKRTIVSDTTSRLEKERAVIMMICKIVKKTISSDGELLVEISGFDSDSTIVCGSVNPDDPVAHASQYRRIFKGVRSDLDTIDVGQTITITGMLHQYQPNGDPTKKQIRNYVGLCPILSVIIGSQDPFEFDGIHKM